MVVVGVALLALVGLGVIAPAGATPPTTWGPPTQLTGANLYLHTASVSIDAAGTATALWSGGDANDARTIRSATQPVGDPWSSPVDLAEEGESPVLAGNSAGDVAAAWEAYDGGIHASSRVAHGDWRPPTTLSVGADAVAKASTARVAIDESGDVIVVWQQRDFPFVHVWAARATVGGGWAAPVLIATNPSDTDMRPDVALDASGEAVVAWMAGPQGAGTVHALDVVGRGLESGGRPRRRARRVGR